MTWESSKKRKSSFTAPKNQRLSCKWHAARLRIKWKIMTGCCYQIDISTNPFSWQNTTRSLHWLADCVKQILIPYVFRALNSNGSCFAPCKAAASKNLPSLHPKSNTVLPPTFMAISMQKTARGLILPLTPLMLPSAPPQLTRRYVWYSLATYEWSWGPEEPWNLFLI